MVVDDEETMRHMLSLVLGRGGYQVITADRAEAALERVRKGGIEVVLCDVRMPEQDGRWLLDKLRNENAAVATVMMSAYVDQDVAVECLKLGARDYISKPFKPDEVLAKVRLALDWLRLESEHKTLARENQQLKGELKRAAGASGSIIGESAAMRDLLALIGKIANYKSTVLILGESGTGKELVARQLHDRSPRAKGPFIPINCGAIPEALLESELFGHVKGAFTDANRDKVGLIEEANGGTLFLDEIGDLPMLLQVKLLRFLQEEEIRRVGDTASVKVDVRVVTATAKDLPRMAAAGQFREDLFYRLNVLQVLIPPLRDRKDDIAVLVEHFVEKYRTRLKREIRGVTPEARQALLAYSWPGNVRELENALEQAMVLADEDMVDLASLPDKIARARPALEKHRTDDMIGPEELSIKKATRVIEETLIRRALTKTGGNRTKAAELLEISHRALLYKIKEFGLAAELPAGRN